jgi:hypothetical protein
MWKRKEKKKERNSKGGGASWTQFATSAQYRFPLRGPFAVGPLATLLIPFCAADGWAMMGSPTSLCPWHRHAAPPCQTYRLHRTHRDSLQRSPRFMGAGARRPHECGRNQKFTSPRTLGPFVRHVSVSPCPRPQRWATSSRRPLMSRDPVELLQSLWARVSVSRL